MPRKPRKATKPAKTVTQRRRVATIYGKQADFCDLQTWVRGFVGGRGTGKTYIGAHYIITRARKGDAWMCVSPDSNVIRETTFPTFLELCERYGVLVRKLESFPQRIWWRTFDGGTAHIIFRSGEAPDKLRGPNKAGLWLDEASVMRKDVLDTAVPTLRQRGVMGPVLMTFTPRGRSHWTFEQFFDKLDDRVVGNDGATADGLTWIQGQPYRLREKRGLIRASSADNPFLPPEFCDNVGSTLSAVMRLQELGGEFVELGGLLFRREWFSFVDQAPRECARVRYWDRAGTPGAGCETAGVLMAKDEQGIVYVEDVIHGQWSASERNQIMLETARADARMYNNEVHIFAEQEGGSAGKEISEQSVLMFAGFPFFRDIVSGKRSRLVDGVELPGDAKMVRASPFSGYAQAGNVRIVRGAWNTEYLGQIIAFPESKLCDMVDASSGAFAKLALKSSRPEAAERDTKEAAPERFGAGYVLERLQRRRAQ